MSESGIHDTEYELRENSKLPIDLRNCSISQYCFRGIHHSIDDRAALAPNSIALSDDSGNELSYSDLVSQSESIAVQLREVGVKRGDLVLLAVGRSVRLAPGVLGILKAGAAYLPLDPMYPQERINFMLQDSGATILVTESTHADRFRGKCKVIFCLDTNLDTKIVRASDTTLPDIVAADPAYVIYTSGTTGKPKGVIVTHGNLHNYSSTLPDAIGLNATDRYLHTASISFSSSVRQLLVPLSVGATVVISSTELIRAPERLLKFIAREKITVLDLVPSYWRIVTKVLDESSADTTSIKLVRSVRLLLSASETLPTNVVRQLIEKFEPGVQIINMYGQTETTGIVSTFTVDTANVENGAGVPIGIPLRNATVHLLDEKMNAVERGTTGELYLGGGGVSRGYLNRPDLTKDTFVDNPFGNADENQLYRTGDLARCLPNGVIEYIGRIDDQVKIRGFRVEPGEIEAVLSHHPDVLQTAVAARETELGEKRLVAYFVENPAAKLSHTELREYLLNRLPDYMVPAAYVSLEEMPLTPTGKTDRKALPEPEWENRNGYRSPSTGTEINLARIWSEVLGIGTIGIGDDFFALGGHSLLATQVLTRIRIECDADISYSTFFDSPIIENLAKIIDERAPGSNRTDIGAISKILGNQQPPLSFAQQRLWFLDKLEPNSCAYNIPFGVRIGGKIDLLHIREALHRLIVRHDSLRTTFETIDGEGLLGVAEQLRVEMPLLDISNLSDEEQDSKVHFLAENEAGKPFDLGNSPLFRTSLIQLAEEKYVLLVSMHHIISDGFSLVVFIDELTRIYDCLANGREIDLPDLRVQYSDFAAWQRNYLDGEVLERELEYWRTRLKGAQPLLELPTDHARPAVQRHKGSSVRFSYSSDLLNKLNQFSQQHRVTLYMTLLAAFKTLLFRHTNQVDIVIGSPIANRNHREVEGLIGFFANTLALRTDLSGNPTFTELIGRVRDECLEAYEHQDMPFEKLVEELNPERSLSYNPLFQVLFGLHNTPPVRSGSKSLSVEPLEIDSRTSKFDLSFLLRETENELRGVVEYETDLFDDTSITMLVDRFKILLESIVKDPGQEISKIPLLPEAEQRKLISEWNNTKKGFADTECIHELFEKQAAQTPDAIAVVFGDQRMTYRGLDSQANQVADVLRGFQIGPDGLVGLCLERSIDLIIGIIGILKAGGAYVPLDPAYPSDRLAMMLEDSGAQVVVSHKNLMALTESESCTVVYLDKDLSQRRGLSPEKPRHRPKADDLAYINYTSGSTGKPKGVAIQHNSLVNYAQSVLELLPKDRPLSFANVSTIAADLGNTCIFPALISGGCVHLLKYEDFTSTDLFRKYISENAIDVLKIVPSHLNALIDTARDGDALPKECLILGGEGLSWDLAEHVRTRKPGCRLINEYGPTEATVGSTIAIVDKLDFSRVSGVSIGRPIQNTSIYILNEKLELAPIGVAGELYIGGAGLARCYLNRPKLTAERFVKNPFEDVNGDQLYKTGDLARYLSSGELEYLGRIDDQVKIRGFRIELGEIENVLKQHPDVKDCVVRAVESGPRDKRLVAYLVAGGRDGAEGNVLRQYLESKLPEYMVPTAFIEIAEIPLNPNGKIDGKALPVADVHESEREYEEPRTKIEEDLAAIWCEVLGVERVGVNDNFFSQGGHSLKAVRMFAKVENKFKKNIPLAVLFEAGTISKLALILEKDEWKEPESSIVPIQPNGTKPPFYCVHGKGGNVILYHPLAEHLGEEQPFYGLQARRVGGRQVGHTSIEEMAEFYVDEIIRFQPEGPYYFGGLSLGGLVAFEMAQQLTRRGRSVGMVVLFDANTPDYRKLMPGTKRIQIRLHDLKGRIQLHKDNLAERNAIGKLIYALGKAERVRLKYRRGIANKYKALVRRVYSGTKGSGAIPAKYIQIENYLHRAGSKYLPKEYSGDVVIFRAQTQPFGVYPEPTLGWSKFVSGKICIVEIPGNHTSMMAEPCVRVLAQELEICLGESQSMEV